MEPASLSTTTQGPDAAEGATEPSGHTRRTFISGIAVAGASTAAAAAALDRTGISDLFGANAEAAPGPITPFGDFKAIAPSSDDALQVPEGYRADILMREGDTFANAEGATLRWGYNNDFLAFMPLPGKNGEEALLFSNFEYPDPFYLHGNPSGATKTAQQIRIEQESVGNGIIHIRRRADQTWEVVSPSPYNRRITGDSPVIPFTGPLANNPAFPGIGASARGSLANCSGGITPWGTVLSCEENYQDYGTTGGYGWTPAKVGTNDYVNGDGTAADKPAKYGWVVEHDPYDPSDTGRKHTALGRFRHENTAFRADADKPFVLYMGDDANDQGIYKFVSTRAYKPGQTSNNMKILTEGTLYIARFEPGGRRTFARLGDTNPTSATSGTGSWTKVNTDELSDTAAKLRQRLTTAVFNQYYATNRPEDVEVARDGTVFVALTNNRGPEVRDAHGSVRTIREANNDAGAMSFTWADYAAGGPRPGQEPARSGFSSPDNLVFDSQDNLWVVTDISSNSLNKKNEYEYHANNAMFMVPTKGPNAGVAYRFANGPIRAELTGPYFTPDEQTLFINVQHPGEDSENALYENLTSYGSYWPEGNKSREQNPARPRPSTVAVTKVRANVPVAGTNVVPPPPAPPRDATRARLSLRSPARQSLGSLRGRGVVFRIDVDEAVTLDVTLSGRLKRAGRSTTRGRGALRRLARTRVTVERAGTVDVRVRPSSALRLLLRRESVLPGLLHVRATDRAGNVTTRTKQLRFD